jgi:membrane-associated phospholipid phosphatase
MAGLSALDARIFHLINRSLQNPLFDLVMPILSNKRYFLLPALVVVLMLLVWGGRRMWVVVAVAVAALALSDLGTNLIKAALHRTRPCHVIPDVHLLVGCTRSFSLPSNHASNMFALAAVGWLGFRRWRWGLVLLAAGVAYSRVYLGVHYPADVLAGALWGGALGWGLTALAARLSPGWFETRTTPPRRVPTDSSS